MGLPAPTKNTLLLVALKAEAAGFIPDGAAPIWFNPNSPRENGVYQQSAYQINENLTLALTGPMGFSSVSVATQVTLCNVGKPAFEQAVNFGAVGAYVWSKSVKLQGAYYVRHSQRFDLVIPERGFEFYSDPIELNDPIGNGVSCLSGSRFSSNFDQMTNQLFIQGDIEDNELSDLAHWCRLLELPLTSIKFVTNQATPEGVVQFEANLAKAQAAGVQLLNSLLSS